MESADYPGERLIACRNPSVAEETLDAPGTVKAYKSLSQVEQAFRSYKTIDLKVRPIYHRLSDRVKAHRGCFNCSEGAKVEKS